MVRGNRIESFEMVIYNGRVRWEGTPFELEHVLLLLNADVVNSVYSGAFRLLPFHDEFRLNNFNASVVWVQELLSCRSSRYI